MLIVELNFLFIGRCLGHSVPKKPFLGRLLHQSVDPDWHTKVYLHDDENYVVEEAFLPYDKPKPIWEKAYYIVKKNSLSWNVELEGNQRFVFELEQKEKETV